jgi:two-component system invasion response regulator UvrY
MSRSSTSGCRRAEGFRVAEKPRHLLPRTRVLAHSAVDDRASVVRMLEGGAVGYLVKGIVSAEILGAIVRAALGVRFGQGYFIRRPEPLSD